MSVKLKQIVEELEQCKFSCEAGPLKNSQAFIDLKELAEKEDEDRRECPRQIMTKTLADLANYIQEIIKNGPDNERQLLPELVKSLVDLYKVL
ncbi:hypothetical protein H1D32_13130 [Anaerobacillus sp. CMMVII]|uniref:hypothetical protein n=1 Tax=Anaerobacillus sp. CMMVII TaxID=2755588 RepID=UPI0021B74F77|nr:hypothetical protein [Anaerobacillus sp. CMMVII]MCT8138599.1 hypothetical protein [Anaerobacillus sp. CMMVII]